MLCKHKMTAYMVKKIGLRLVFICLPSSPKVTIVTTLVVWSTHDYALLAASKSRD